MSDTAPLLAPAHNQMECTPATKAMPVQGNPSRQEQQDALKMLAIGGVIALGFGLMTLVGTGDAPLPLVFGLYAILDGILAIVIGVSAADQRAEWWPLTLSGDITVISGAVALTAGLMLPSAGFQVHAAIVAVLALACGVVSIALGLFVRGSETCGRSLALKGALVSGFAGLVVLSTMVSGVPVWMLLGAYAAIVGGTLLALTLRKSLLLQTEADKQGLPASVPWLEFGGVSLLRRGATER